MTPTELKAAMEALLLSRMEMHKYSDGRGEFALNQDGWESDPEVGHSRADSLMVATLRALGYGEAMDIYEAQVKWYS